MSPAAVAGRPSASGRLGRIRRCQVSLDRTRAEERLGADLGVGVSRPWPGGRSSVPGGELVACFHGAFADARIAQAPVLSKGTVRNYRSAAMTVNSATEGEAEPGNWSRRESKMTCRTPGQRGFRYFKPEFGCLRCSGCNSRRCLMFWSASLACPASSLRASELAAQLLPTLGLAGQGTALHSSRASGAFRVTRGLRSPGPTMGRGSAAGREAPWRRLPRPPGRG